MKTTTMKKITTGLSIIFILMASTAFTGTYDGYTLYGKMGNNKVYLIDMNKVTYHTWTNSYQNGYSVYLKENQHIVRGVQYNGNQLQGPAMCGMVQELDWNSNVIWQYTYSTSTYCTHHDIHVMPNGNVLLIAYEVKTATEVVAAGGAQSMIMWPDKIVEVQPNGTNGGTVVWEWHAWDHLVQDHDASKANYGTVSAHPELLNINYMQQKDWMHVNGIDYNPDLDQIVISSHMLNEIYVIDHSTTTAEAASHSGGNSGKGGDILYRWGNPAAYGQGTSSNQVFRVVHDAHWIPAGYPWATRLVAFNNQGGSGNSSCVDMIMPPYNGYTYTYTSGAYAPSTYLWRHNCLANAQDQSSSQKLPNGNLLICIASSGYIYEIDSLQNLLWSATVGGTVAKSFRYSACYVNGGLSVTASATPSTLCAGKPSQLYAQPGASGNYSYTWSSIPTGFSSNLQNPVASPLVSTIYLVSISDNDCTAQDSVSVTVNSVPAKPVITPGHDTLYSSSATGNQWYLDGNTITGATSDYLVVTQQGSYTVEVTGSNGCVSELSDPFIWVGTNDIVSADNTAPVIYPNPASGKINICWASGDASKLSLSFFDLFGRQCSGPASAAATDISTLNSGIYIVLLTKDGSLISRQKIIISHN